MTERRMASGNIISATPEGNEPKGGISRRNSTGRVITRPSLSPSNSEEKLLPHYLRASTSSCHDFCKYGRKHAFEAKGKHPIYPIFTRSKEPIKNVNTGERKVKPVIKLKASPEKTTELSVNPQICTPVMKGNTVKPTIILKPKHLTVKSSSLLKNLGGQNGRRNSENTIFKNVVMSKSIEKKALNPSTTSLSPRPSVNGVASIKPRKYGTTTGLSKSREKKASNPPTTSLSTKPPVNGVVMTKTRTYGNKKNPSPAENQNGARKSEPDEEEVSERTLYVIEPRAEQKSLEPVKSLVPVQVETSKKQSSISTLSLSLSSSLTSSLSLSFREEEEEEEESESESNAESKSETETSFCELNGSSSEHSETEEKDPVEISKGDDKKWLRRGSMINHDDNESLPHVLKFRRGKVVSLHSENNGPRKLRFRQGRVVGENLNGKGEVGRRSFRRRKELDGDSNSNNPESQSVVLKHQDVEGKKDAQGLLFNDVIEETANKLVEKRKSKVKALVGAFETVISLQENKSFDY